MGQCCCNSDAPQTSIRSLSRSDRVVETKPQRLRVWINNLYICLDLKKYDEAIQTCTELINLKARKKSAESIPTPEEKCVRAIVGGSLKHYHDTRLSGDQVALDSSKRTLARVQQLLDRMKSIIKLEEAWIYEVSAHFSEAMGRREDVFNDLMKEYRTLQSAGWENDPIKMSQMMKLVTLIVEAHKTEGTKESLVKGKFLINGVMKKIRSTSCDSEPLKEVKELNAMLLSLTMIMASAAK